MARSRSLLIRYPRHCRFLSFLVILVIARAPNNKAIFLPKQSFEEDGADEAPKLHHPFHQFVQRHTISSKHQPSRAILPGDAFKLLALQEDSSTANSNSMVLVSKAEPSPSCCDTMRRKDARLTSTTTTLAKSAAGHHGPSSTSSKLWCVCIPTSTTPEMFLVHGLDEDGWPACWSELLVCICVELLFTGQCAWAPPEVSWSIWRRWLPSAWVPLEINVPLAGYCWKLATKYHGHYVFYMHTFIFSTSVQHFTGQVVEKGISYKFFLLCTLFGCKRGSGKTFLNVRADLRPWSMLVLRFNVEKSGVNFLSPVKAIRYLRLKIRNPHRHMPVRQPRGAPTVLSECNKEDPRCFWRGYPSTQRPRRIHHLCLPCQKCRHQSFRLQNTLSLDTFNLSHCFDSFVVAQKLHFHLGWYIPTLCTLDVLS